MSEIKVKYESLQEQNIELKKLLSGSELSSKLNACYLRRSKGEFAAASEEKCMGKTLELTRAFQLLVRNTMTFLNEAGVVFQEADTNAACRVDELSGGIGSGGKRF